MPKWASMKVLQPTPEAIETAVHELRAGRLVAFPTETVYGLGADATNPEALKRLYEAKGRPTNHPVIVHLSDVDQLDAWAARVPDGARRLARALWPGPLTLILPKADHVSDQITGGQSTVGLRIPRHDVAAALLRAFGGGVAAPSANKFGRLSPTTAHDVAQEFESEAAIVLDGGPCDVGIESTIVDFSGEHPRILRPGMILPQQIEAIAGVLEQAGSGATANVPRAPGSLLSHYAPLTPTKLVSPDELADKVRRITATGKRVCVLAFQECTDPRLPWVVAAPEPARYAQQLYRTLRELDREGADVILVESVPASDEWSAVADRLRRATAEANHSD
jgi:L-threonylcarbamoyladenylate synthase